MSLLSDVTFAKITARVAKIDASDRKVQNIFKFKITTGGNVVKTWILDLLMAKVYVGDDDAECTITVDDETMVALGEGKITTVEAVSQGKIQIDGDMSLALKLGPFVTSL